MTRTAPPLLSGLPRIAWPAMVSDRAAQLLALQYQFDATQWLPPAELRRRQFEQLTSLLRHAAATVVFHAERLAAAGIDTNAPLTEEAWSRIPILTRQQVQQEGQQLRSTAPPPSHGRVVEMATSGSTGTPVRVLRTELDGQMWNAVTIREELWHREDFTGTIARIRSLPRGLTPDQQRQARTPHGVTLPNWGPPDSLLWQTGRMSMLHPDVPIPDQARWLLRLAPQYLLTLPANLRLLLHYFREARLLVPTLLAVWTLSEVVEDALRALCREVLRVPIVHNYSAAELGYIALQCPEHDVFHVQSEAVFVEVLDDAGRVCAPGQIGRVVITPLHSFAMPLLRYEIGDEAEPGEVCSCGRGLPVLTRVVGRTQDYVVLPSGERRRYDLPHYRLSRVRPVREFQVVQRSLTQIELRLVVARSLTADEEQVVRGVLREAFPEFECAIDYRASLPRTRRRKLRPFVSELPV